jgi:methyltransferase
MTVAGMSSTESYVLLVLAVGLARLVELSVARRNTRWSRRHGAVETGRGHYPVMVALHLGLLVGCVAEVLAADRPFVPALGASMLGLLLASHVLRWWCIAALGRQWNTRVIVVPGLPRVTGGPYRWLRHPNYVAVIAEGIALPLVHTAWLTALLFTVGNAALLAVRVRAEEAALEALALAGGVSPERSTR